MSLKSLLRQSLPHGWIEARHRRFALSRLGLPSSRRVARDVETCRYDLWPDSLRREPQPWTLVDVGANVGDFVSAAARLRPLRAVHAFEPQPACREILARRLEKLPAATLVPAAVGRSEGTLSLHLTSNHRMASGLLPDPTIRSRYSGGDFEVTEVLPVPMVALDSALPPDEGIGLLKIDVQGYELEVLAGASATLQRTRALLVEINYVRHYREGAGFDELYSALRDCGFRVFGISAPFTDGNGEPLWADALFTR